MHLIVGLAAGTEKMTVPVSSAGEQATVFPTTPSSAGIDGSPLRSPRRTGGSPASASPVYQDSPAELLRFRDELLCLREARRGADAKRTSPGAGASPSTPKGSCITWVAEKGAAASNAPCPAEEGSIHDSTAELVQRRDEWRKASLPQVGECGDEPTASLSPPPPRKSPVIAGSVIADSGASHRRNPTCLGVPSRFRRSSFPLVFRRQDFLSLAEAVAVTGKKKVFGPPFDIGGRGFRLDTMDKSFPFEKVEEDSLMLKFAPIKLCWMKRSSGSGSLDRVCAGKADAERDGQNWKERWF